MKVDFNTPILALDGSEFPEKPTLKTVSIQALQSPLPGDDQLDPMDKVRMFSLSLKIYEAENDVSLSSEEITLLKTRIGKGFPPLVVGRTWLLLDPASVR